jgi:transcriptional regulator with XRE-family HTH domain
MEEKTYQSVIVTQDSEGRIIGLKNVNETEERANELNNLMMSLRMTKEDLAKKLSVDIRTVTRWLSGKYYVSEAALQTLRAWRRLDRLTLAYGANSVDIGISDYEIRNILKRHLNV